MLIVEMVAVATISVATRDSNNNSLEGGISTIVMSLKSGMLAKIVVTMSLVLTRPFLDSKENSNHNFGVKFWILLFIEFTYLRAP